MNIFSLLQYAALAVCLRFVISLTVKPLGSGAFGQVFLAQATGIVAFDPRGSTKRKPGRRRSRFGSTSRPYYNDKRVTAVAVKSLKGKSVCLGFSKIISNFNFLIVTVISSNFIVVIANIF